MGVFGVAPLCYLHILGVLEQKEWDAFCQIWNKGLGSRGPGDYSVDAKVRRNLAAKLFD